VKTITVDIGNTRSKYVVWSNEGLMLEHGSDVLMVDLLARFPDSKMVVSCVGKRDEVVPVEAKFLEVGGRFPFEIVIEQPHTLGVDRLAGMLGAFHKFSESDLLVIDLGSCVTYDYLYLEGDHGLPIYAGGAISPGLRFRYVVMSEHTAALPYLGDEVSIFLHVVNDVEKNTVTAMHSGVLLGFLDEVSGRVDRFFKEYQDGLVVFTGGDAELIHEKLGNRWKSKIFVEPWLVHYGLYHAL
jgi:type III pantothenate kinase